MVNFVYNNIKIRMESRENKPLFLEIVFLEK